VAQSEQNKHHHHHQPKPKPGTPAQRRVAGTIYNETSALRPTADKGGGSPSNLSDARTALAQTSLAARFQTRARSITA